MKLRAPLYYKKFKCIADKCSKSCCSAGWEIDIDDETANYYTQICTNFNNKLDKELLEKLQSNIITNKDGSSKTFKLTENNNCPFLNKNKLCDIYINLGEEHMCNICKEHPRFYEWFNNIKEVGIGLCCEEACRIILVDNNQFSTYEIDIPYEDCDEYDEEIYSYLFKTREQIINYINNSTNLHTCIKNLTWFCNVIQQDLDSGLLDDEEIFDINDIEKSDITYILNYLLTLESNSENWHKYLKNSIALYNKTQNKLNKFNEFENSHPEINIYLKNILLYFVWRYLLKGVFDEEILSKFSFGVISVAVLETLFFCKWLETGNISLGDCVEIVTNFSEEIEYNEDNVNRLADACYDLNDFSVENLMGLF